REEGSATNIKWAAFDFNGDGRFDGPEDFKTTSIDANGNFSFTIPNLLPGTYNMAAQVVDKANNAFTTSIKFAIQGPSLSNWQAVGPGPIDVRGTGVNYPTVAGKVTAVATDPRDPSGNTFYIGGANGGVWRTEDGGASWTPLTDSLVSGGQKVLANIGAMAAAVNLQANPGNPPLFIYAATGVADNEPSSRAGTGILKSTD